MRRPPSPYEELKGRIIQAVGVLLIASVACGAVIESASLALNSLYIMGGIIIVTVIIMAVEVFRQPKT